MDQMHCPMAANDKGADWLQESADEVQNPYFGARMPHCGKIVKRSTIALSVDKI